MRAGAHPVQRRVVAMGIVVSCNSVGRLVIQDVLGSEYFVGYQRYPHFESIVLDHGRSIAYNLIVLFIYRQRAFR